MNLLLRPLTEAHVHEMSRWRYAPPYNVYNLDDPPDAAAIAYWLDPVNAGHVIVDEAEKMVGFCSFGPDGQVPGGDYSAPALDIGMGMHPDLTGQGNGERFATAVITYAQSTFAPKTLRVTIAAFNTRAINVWVKAGFRPVQRFQNSHNHFEFIIFVRDK